MFESIVIGGRLEGVLCMTGKEKEKEKKKNKTKL